MSKLRCRGHSTTPSTRLGNLIGAATATVVVLVCATVLLTDAPARADDVKVTPTASGLGNLGTTIQNALNWGGQIALWASLGSILAGAAVWGLSKHFGNYGAANKGMTLAIGGGVGALLVAMAPTIVNSMFHA